MASAKKLILFDIDFTVFDNNAFRSNYRNYLFLNLGLNEDQVESVYLEYKNSLKADRYFRPKQLITNLCNAFELEHELVFKNTFGKSDNYLSFVETDEILERLSKKYTLGIWTEGLRGWQWQKVKNMKLDHYFDPAHKYIFPNKTTDRAVAKLPYNVVVIDDKISNIDLLLKHGGRFPVWINRKNDDMHPCTPTVKNFLEFETWLNQNY